jgi:hypothetical protein
MTYELYLKRAQALLGWYKSGHMEIGDYSQEVMKLMKEHEDDIKKHRLELLNGEYKGYR